MYIRDGMIEGSVYNYEGLGVMKYQMTGYNHANKKFGWIYLAVTKADSQTAKFNSPPNFLALR